MKQKYSQFIVFIILIYIKCDILDEICESIKADKQKNNNSLTESFQNIQQSDISKYNSNNDNNNQNSEINLMKVNYQNNLTEKNFQNSNDDNYNSIYSQKIADQSFNSNNLNLQNLQFNSNNNIINNDILNKIYIDINSNKFVLPENSKYLYILTLNLQLKTKINI